MSRRLPPLNAVRAFEAAARHLSFTRAADELCVTQAAVSHQVKMLESWLGISLFHRQNRALTLTGSGQSYRLAIHEALEQIARATDQVVRQDAGPLTISTIPSLAAKWLVLRLGRFQAAHPEWDVRLTTGFELVDFEKQQVDIAIRFGRGYWPGLKVERLMTEDLFPVCSPHLFNSDKPLKTPEDLRYHTLLHDEYQIDWPMWLRAADVQGVEVNRGPRFTDSGIQLQAAIDGQGVALARAVLVADDIAAGRLVRLFDVTLPGDFAYWIVAPPHYFSRPKVAAFRDWLLIEARQTQI